MIFTFYTVISTGQYFHQPPSRRQTEGRGLRRRVYFSFFCSLALSLVAGGVLSLFAHRFMEMMQLSGQVLEDAAVYFRICISFSFFQALISAISAVFRSYGLP